jgi:hypothetical protein
MRENRLSGSEGGATPSRSYPCLHFVPPGQYACILVLTRMVDLWRFDAQFSKTYTTLEQAQAYVCTLPWDQRLQIWRVPVFEWRFAKKPSPSPLCRLRRAEAYLSLSDAGHLPTQNQVGQLAVTIYRVVKQAKRLAKRGGKPLRILAGESGLRRHYKEPESLKTLRGLG